MELVKKLDDKFLQALRWKIGKIQNDETYQKFAKKVCVELGLNDGFCYSISLNTGFIHKGQKMKISQN